MNCGRVKDSELLCGLEKCRLVHTSATVAFGVPVVDFCSMSNFLWAVPNKDLYIESGLGDSAAGDTWTR